MGLVRDGFAQIAETLKIQTTREQTLDIVEGTNEYDLPADRLGMSIQEIRVEPASGLGSVPLRKIDPQHARDVYDFGNLTNGVPMDWVISDNDQTKFRILPQPNFTKSDSIVIVYSVLPEFGRSFYQGTTFPITLTLTFNTSLGILTGPLFAGGEVEIGDEIGPIPTTQEDGTALTGHSAERWVKMLDIAPGTITLDRVWRWPTETAVNFMTGEVHPIEMMFPGKLRNAPADLALAEHFRPTDPDRASGLQNAALAAVSRIDVGLDMTEMRGPNHALVPWGGTRRRRHSVTHHA